MVDVCGQMFDTWIVTEVVALFSVLIASKILRKDHYIVDYVDHKSWRHLV